MERISILFLRNAYSNALRSCVVLPKYKSVKNNIPVIKIVVSEYGPSALDMLTQEHKLELHSRDTRENIKNILTRVQELDGDLLDAKMMQINKSGVDILQLRKEENINDEDRIIFVEINSYREALLAELSSKWNRVQILVAVVLLLSLGYKIQEVLTLMKVQTDIILKGQAAERAANHVAQRANVNNCEDCQQSAA